MAKSIEELRAERRALEDLANMSLYERFTSGLGNMFDTTDPLAPKFGDVVGGMPSMPNTRTADMTMTGATTDALGNIIPSANATTGVLGGPIPDYAKPRPMQGITLNPGFTPGGSDPIYSVYDEFNQSGSPDLSFSLFRPNVFLPPRQERTGVSADLSDLNAAGKEKFARINKELQAIPRSDMTKRREFVANKDNQLNINDFNTQGKLKFGVTQDAKGKDINVLSGGILQSGGTDPVNLDARLPSFQDKTVDGSTGVLSELPGSTVQQTIDDSGMKLIAGGQVAVPTRQSLQYTGDKVPFMSPAIKADMDASGIGLAGYQNILDNYVKKTPVKETSFMDSLGGITGMVGLLGDIMVMQSLLDNKQQAPAASAPRGLVGAKISEDDPYKRRF